MALASLIRSGLALQPGIYRENGSGKKTVQMFLFVSDLEMFDLQCKGFSSYFEEALLV